MNKRNRYNYDNTDSLLIGGEKKSLNYDAMISALLADKTRNRARRIEQLNEIENPDIREWYLNQDDYGCLPMPAAGSRWQIIPNHKNGSFYGIDACTENFCDLMEKHPLYVNPDDAFAGRWMYFLSAMRMPNIWNPEFPYTELEKKLKKYSIISGIGGDAHFAPDFNIGLKLGWKGLINKIKYHRDRNGEDKINFYDCHLRIIYAVQQWIKRHIEAAEELISHEVDDQRKKNLSNVIECNKAIIENPPSTFRQALQWVIWFHLASRTFNRDGAGGQLDELFRPYYENDIASGVLTDDEAVYLLSCFLISDPMYWQLAGPDPETGEDMTSRLSWLILDAAAELNCSLNLTVRVHEKIDEDFFDKAVRCLVKYKNAWPRFSGDKALVEGFMKNGYSKELARKRIAVGCNWMSLPGLEYTLNDLVKINFAKILEVSFDEIMSSKSSRPGTEKLWSIFKKHLESAVDVTVMGIKHHLKYQQYNTPELLLNLLSHGPLEKGLDISAGGAEFYNLAIDGAGLATFADSMAALEQRIEIEKLITWEETARNLSVNWSGNEGERARQLMLNSERFGRGNSIGDKWAVKLSSLFSELVISKSDDNHKFIPGLFSWASTIPMGRDVKATANGRKDQEPISHGANPHAGFCDDGASTALALAIAKVQPGYGNTAPMQIELDPSCAQLNQKDNIKSLILTHFKLGGTLININVVDKETLYKAHREPEKYPDLVVRVTGFTAYFSTLTEEFRKLVVDRVLST
ncbi:pyruvate formate lyase family protein [Lentisphaerota bacterium ZTH]|nr:formate acetyltransferase [Lentisphaerota bacterium]WET05911.1 pyruvate formate lyase family protein [Lentisphaerota bacterium ZTH]